MEHHMQLLQKKEPLQEKQMLQNINLKLKMCKLYEASMFETFARIRSNTRRRLDFRRMCIECIFMFIESVGRALVIPLYVFESCIIRAFVIFEEWDVLAGPW